MEPSYSEWKNVIIAGNKIEKIYCPHCQNSVANMMTRYVTDRNGERFQQYRGYCPVCRKNGKTYQNKNVAKNSWTSAEHEPAVFAEPKKRRRT